MKNVIHIQLTTGNDQPLFTAIILITIIEEIVIKMFKWLLIVK